MDMWKHKFQGEKYKLIDYEWECGKVWLNSIKWYKKLRINNSTLLHYKYKQISDPYMSYPISKGTQ